MDLAFSTSEIEFRDEIRTWLNEHKPSEKWLAMDTEIGFEQHRTWEHKHFESKWSVPNWPKEYGGRDCSLIEWLFSKKSIIYLKHPVGSILMASHCLGQRYLNGERRIKKIDSYSLWLKEKRYGRKAGRSRTQEVILAVFQQLQ